jgi:hypothetical protein
MVGMILNPGLFFIFAHSPSMVVGAVMILNRSYPPFTSLAGGRDYQKRKAKGTFAATVFPVRNGRRNEGIGQPHSPLCSFIDCYKDRI